jgi:pyridoxal phosphate enzyme (YggS family)
MSISENIQSIDNQLINKNAKLIAVTKTKPNEMLMEAYQSGMKRFGENYVQELLEKYEKLPKDIEWHLIGHLQSNKVKYIAPFVSLIHSVDSFRLLQEINKQAQKNNRIIDCLLQVFIAEEDTKTGMNTDELYEILGSNELSSLSNIRIIGLMGMSTFTDDIPQIRKEFRHLKNIFDTIKTSDFGQNHPEFKEISMGMSGDWQIAIEEGSTMIRVGSAIFGSR